MMNETKYCVLSIHEPWASLLAHGIKKNETRPRETRWRGIYLIHATANTDITNAELKNPFTGSLILDNNITLYPGHIVGAFRVKSCFKILYEDEEGFEVFNHHLNRFNIDNIELWLGSYCSGKYVWEGTDHRVLRYPIPYKGQQGYYNKYKGDKNKIIFL